MQEFYTDGDVVFQQDNATCHTSKKCRSSSNDGVKVLDWLGNSPDLNLIESLWSIVKKRLIKSDCTIIGKIICVVIWIWYYNEKMCNTGMKLGKFLLKCVQILIKSRGGHINQYNLIICLLSILLESQPQLIYTVL